MRSKKMFSVSVLSVLLLLQVPFGILVEFDRNLFGVVVVPYVKNREQNEAYSFGEVQTMLRVVSKKFGRVLTEGNHVLEGSSYFANRTYYYSTFVSARIPEAAAIVNREQQNRSLTVVVGITIDDEYETTAVEVNVALDALKIANSIFPGTVTGILISKFVPSSSRWIAYIRDKTKGQNLEIGLHVLCPLFMQNDENTTLNDLAGQKLPVHVSVLAKVDFICCDGTPDQNISHNGGKFYASFFGNQLLKSVSAFQALEPKIKVMGATMWPSTGQESFQNIIDFLNVWTGLNEFATNHSIEVWLKGAFDNPNSDRPNLGWWNLSNENLVRNMNAYTEKVSAIRELFQSGDDGSTPGIEIHNDSNETSGTEEIVDSKINTHSDPGAWTMITAGVVFLFVVVIAASGTLFYFKMRLQTLQSILNSKEIEEFKNGISPASETSKNDDSCNLLYSSAFEMPYDSALEIPKQMMEVHWDKVLGSGQFGTVCKGTIAGSNRKDVAIKTTKRDSPANAWKGLLSEIKIMAYIGNHENVINIVGAYTSEMKKGLVYVALELCTNGSLKNHLIGLNHTKQDTNFKHFLHWSYEIACGMAHLERKRVIHADLATRNVLLTSDYTAKISDFGLSRRLANYANYVKTQQEPLPWRPMAIESLKMLEFSHSSDVWSFGVTLWEIFSFGQEPFSCMTWSHDFVKSLEDGLRLKKPAFADQEMYKTMTSCWNRQPSGRPTFKALKDYIKRMVDETNYTDIHI